MATVAGPRSTSGALDRYFKISERGSTVRTELIAGLTTWMTMAYILFVNPSILGSIADQSGLKLESGQVLIVTALVAGCMSILMGAVANYPFALAAGLGLNGFVAFTLVAGQGLSWPDAMGVIVIEGLVILALVITGFREAVLNAIPMDIKRAIGVGIGAFIAFIGLNSAGFAIRFPAEAGPPVTIGELDTMRFLVFFLGLVVTASLVARKVKGALLIGILGTTIFATIVNEIRNGKVFGDVVASVPDSWASVPGGHEFELLGNFSLGGAIETIGFVSAAVAIFAVMLADFFDTMGTAVGLGEQAGFLDKDGKLPGVGKVLLVDSAAAAAGGAASSSSNTTYIESAAGIAEGGRTGLTAVVVGVLFLACLFISPIAGIIPPQATAPALVLVGYFMMTLVKDIDWKDPEIGIPALLTIVVQPFTFSITNGVGAGFIAFTAMKILKGRPQEVHPLMYVSTAAFMAYFIRGLIA
ncbi:MAG TPA: NCS2 family permease [Actinomycetota bacterium]|nr:NCS2 family permease [Actinomycetota bacterium]